MMKDGNPNAFTRQVHFANGFPSKGLVRDVSLYGQSAYASPRGHFVSLDEVSPRVGRTHRTIPPLAKGRGQFCSMKARTEDDRYKRRPDPFKLPKATEKTGFSASQIKHAKPKMIRECRSTEPASHSPATATVYNLKNMAGRTVYSTSPNRPLDSDLDDDVMTPSVELKSKNIRIISDVEKESIQAELAGLEEVYQRVCRGRIESLYSLLYPSRRETKRGPTVQFINTSTPVQLRTPRIGHHSKRPTREKNVAKVSVESSEVENMDKDGTTPLSFPGSELENSTRSVLIPLPYIRSVINVTTQRRHEKPTYNMPYVYGSKIDKAAVWHSHTLKNASPAVINFNAMNIPEVNRPGTKNGIVGSRSSMLNKFSSITVPNTGPAPNYISTAFMCSPRPFKSTTPTHTQALFHDRSDSLEISKTDVEPKLSKLDIESIDSEEDYSVQPMADDSAADSNVVLETSTSNEVKADKDSDVMDKRSDQKLGEDIMAKGIRFSLTTDVGIIRGVDIYDYDKRDVEAEHEAAKHIEEMEELGQKKTREYAELLEEHQHILDEFHELEKELNKPE